MSRRDWYDLGGGIVVLLVGLVDLLDHGPVLAGLLAGLVVSALSATGVGLHRLAPGPALSCFWGAGALTLAALSDLPLVLLSAPVVAFGCARYGSSLVLALSGISIPLGAAIGFGWLVVLRTGFSVPVTVVTGARGLVPAMPVMVVGALAALLILLVPWLVGLTLRMRDRAVETRAAQSAAEESARVAVAARDEAQELAAVRDAQARMARDVHDVVGHSLAVILAQAEAAKVLADTDPAAYRRSAQTIADTARASLGDVRRVLETAATGGAAPPGNLDGLIESVRASGVDVDWSVSGTPLALPDDHATAAHRVLQEMLTNALKHGQRGSPITARAAWEATALRIEVANHVAAESPNASVPPGVGVQGMRRRVSPLGGRVTTGSDGDVFTAALWLPIPGESG